MNRVMLAGGIVAMGLMLHGATNETEAVAATNGVAAVQQSSQDDADVAKCAADRARIEGLLKKADLVYEDKLAEYKSYCLSFAFDDGRTQRLRVFGETGTWNGYEMVTISSLAYDGVLTKAMMQELLSSDQSLRWYIRQQENGFYTVYCDAKCPIDIAPEHFKGVCSGVAAIADSLEKKWTDADEL